MSSTNPAAALLIASPPWPSSPPIFFSPTPSYHAPSPSPIVAAVSDSQLPEAAIVGGGVAGAVVASVLVTAIASKMGCSLLAPLLSVVSFIFKKFLGIKRCPDILRFRGRRRDRSSKGNGSVDDEDDGEYNNTHRRRDDRRRPYDREDSCTSEYNRNSLISPSMSAQYSRRHRYRDGNHDDVAIDVWEELEVSRKHVQDQARDVGYMLRPTRSNISKFAAAEMRKLGGLHDAALLQMNKNIINEGHDRIQSVSVAVGRFEVGQQRLMKVSIDGSCSEARIDSGAQLQGSTTAAIAAQMQQLRENEVTQQSQLVGIANGGTSVASNQQIHHQMAIDIDNQEQRPSVGSVNVNNGQSNPSTQDTASAGAATASQQLPIGTAADAVRPTTDGGLLETETGRNAVRVHPNSKTQFFVPPSSSSISLSGINYSARDPPPRLNSNELQLVTTTTTPAAQSRRRRRARAHETTAVDRHRVSSTHRKSNKRRRLSRVAGVKVSCELSVHFMKFFVFCKSGTNYGEDGNTDNKQQDRHIEDEDKEDSNEHPRLHRSADSVQSLPYVINLPSDHSGALLTAPPSLQFYQPSPWQTYPAQQAASIVGSGGVTNASGAAAASNVNTAAASNITHGGYPHSSSTAASSSAVVSTPAVPPSVVGTAPAAAEFTIAGIGSRYGQNYCNSSMPASYQLIPVLDAAGNYVISSGGNFAKVALLMTPAMPSHAHHHVTISETVVSGSETNSVSDKEEVQLHVQEASSTAIKTLRNPATAGNSSLHRTSESKSTAPTLP